jgi:hypothetical protein
VNFSRKKRERSERWLREDAAPRLNAVAPELLSLKLELNEGKRDQAIAGRSSIRHVVVASAGAIFEFRCGNCRDGEYDVTRQVLAGLERKHAEFKGEAGCSGSMGEQACDCVLDFVAHAEYR